MDRRLVILFLTIFIDLMGFGIFIPVVPFVARDLGASDALVGDTAVVFSVLMYLFGPFWGAVSDRYGRRPVIAIAVAISGVSYLLFSFAHGIVLLFISRMLTGVGSANIAAAQAYITDITPPEHRAKSLGLVGAAFGLGFIAGPPLGGVVYHYFGTAWVGYVAACLCLVNLLGIWLLLPESLHQRDPHAPIRFAPITATVRALRDIRFRDIYLIGFIYIAAFSMMQTAVPLLWKDDYGLTEAQISYMFAAVGLASAIVQGGLLGWLNKRFGERRLVIMGTILVAVGLAAHPAWCPGPSSSAFSLIGPIALLSRWATPAVAVAGRHAHAAGRPEGAGPGAGHEPELRQPGSHRRSLHGGPRLRAVAPAALPGRFGHHARHIFLHPRVPPPDGPAHRPPSRSGVRLTFAAAGSTRPRILP